jgi:microcystin-dependent protein
MGNPFLGEIRVSRLVLRGWAQCNGQFLPINQNQALFSILGTQYGGNGQTTFALPDLREDANQFRRWANDQRKRPVKAHAVTINEMPTHTHRCGG